MKALEVAGEAAAYSVVITTLAGILPPLAALASILWIGFQFYHSEPIKQWRKERKELKNGQAKVDESVRD
jgi:hypothetical protein